MPVCECCLRPKDDLKLYGKGITFLYCKSCMEVVHKDRDVSKRKGRPRKNKRFIASIA